MVDRLKQTVLLQIFLLIAAGVAIYGLSSLTKYEPRIALSVDALVRGAAGGLITWFGTAAVHLLLLQWRSDHGDALAQIFERRSRRSWAVRLGAVVTGTCGEEPLLRVYVLGPLTRASMALGLVVNACLSALTALERRTRPTMLLAAAFKGTMLACIFLQHRSVTAVVVARAVTEIATIVSERALPVHAIIAERAYSWRKRHALRALLATCTAARR